MSVPGRKLAYQFFTVSGEVVLCENAEHWNGRGVACCSSLPSLQFPVLHPSVKVAPPSRVCNYIALYLTSHPYRNRVSKES